MKGRVWDLKKPQKDTLSIFFYYQPWIWEFSNCKTMRFQAFKPIGCQQIICQCHKIQFISAEISK